MVGKPCNEELNVPMRALQLHCDGVGKVKVAEQLGSAEKVAVTTQVLPFAIPERLKLEELPKGALKTWDPPQLLVNVKVPVAGALV